MEPSIYEYAGGAPAFERLAVAMHARCLADPVLEHPFSHTGNPRHLENLAAYWAEVLGGPPAYTTSVSTHSAMLALHAGEGADSDLGERFLACFLRALDDAGFPPQERLRSALRAYMEWAVAEVMACSPPGSRVPDGLPMPHWDWAGLRQ